MEFIKKVRENLKDPKKKSATLLSMYVVFFIFVFALISSNNYSTSEETIINKTLNYEYEVKINDNDNLIYIKGIYKDNINSFKYNGVDCVNNSNNLYCNNLNIDNYKYETIELLLENSESITTYKNSNNKVYNISLNKYFDIFKEDNYCNTTECENMLVSIMVEKDDFIHALAIDLSSYYGYNYKIEIKYNII
jgi:hypothetical protein